jgi:hypothetical protein
MFGVFIFPFRPPERVGLGLLNGDLHDGGIDWVVHRYVCQAEVNSWIKMGVVGDSHFTYSEETTVRASGTRV